MKKNKINDKDVLHDLIMAGAPYNLVVKLFDKKKEDERVSNAPEHKGPK